MRLTLAALTACFAFLSAAMTVSLQEDEPEPCTLMANGISNDPMDYKCKGRCPLEGPQSGYECEMTVQDLTIRCLCGDYTPFEGCLGEYDMAEDGVGYFCYTMQGCTDSLECDLNTAERTVSGWWTVCVCK